MRSNAPQQTNPIRSPRRRGRSALLSFDICSPDHLAPGPDFNLDPLREFLWCPRDRIVSKRYQAFPHVRLANDRDDFAIEQLDDVLWRSGRNEYSHPAVTLYVWIAGFCHRFYIKQGLRTRLARYRECP